MYKIYKFIWHKIQGEQDLTSDNRDIINIMLLRVVVGDIPTNTRTHLLITSLLSSVNHCLILYISSSSMIVAFQGKASKTDCDWDCTMHVIIWSPMISLGLVPDIQVSFTWSWSQIISESDHILSQKIW